MKSDLKLRTKTYALQIIRLYTSLPKTAEFQVIGKQVLRSGTSVGAHYRETYRSRSDAEFVSKMEVALQELDETGYWLELLLELFTWNENALTDLATETNELTAIFIATVQAVKNRKGS